MALVVQASAAEAGSTLLGDLLTLGGLVTAPETWLLLTLLLMILEIFTFGFFLGAVAVSSALTALVAWGGASANAQVAVFAISTIASMLWLRPVFVRLLAPTDTPTGSDALIGKIGIVVAQVPAGGTGRVKVVNEEWRATAVDTLGVGEPVRITAVQGNTVTVQRT